MAFNWEEENNNDTFMDIPDEVHQGQAPHTPIINSGNVRPQQPLPATQQFVSQSVEELIYEVQEESEEDFETVLADAELRIELATLYKLIMNHDLFDGMDVDQRAIDTVHKEIRKFARERMEIMLGMKQESPKESRIISPFNDLEVDILKKLASAATKGATQSPEANKTAQVIKQPRKEGLNTISAPKTSKPKAMTSKPATQALVAKAQAPIQRQPKPVLEQMKEAYVPPTKNPDQVTSEELLQRNKEVSARQSGRKQAKSTTSIPMPNEHQEAMFQEQRVMTSDNPLANPNAVSAIVAAINKSKSQ